MQPNAYRKHTFEHLRAQLEAIGPIGRALDFGSGDGWFAHSLMESGLVEDVVCVDVMRRERHYIEPEIYEGERLPFDDRAFDLVYAVDVFHHTPDPPSSLRDALRCSRSHFVLKDHNYRRRPAKFVLAALDEIGNRRFGVPTLYKYQHDWDWLPVIEDEGFEREDLQDKIRCEPRPVLSLFVNEFQFIGRWRRAASGARR